MTVSWEWAEETIELHVPGRLCILGEHSDWSGAYRRHNPAIRPGRTIVVGTEQGLYARVRRLEEPRLVLHSTKDDGTQLRHEVPMDPERLAEEASAGGFWSYAAGVAYKMAVEFGVGGLEVDNYKTTLPLKKGLSSSAAFCVLVARAFNRVYRLQLTTRGEMEFAYQGERLTPSQCGRLDQACAFGRASVLMTYDGDLLHVSPAALGAPLHFVLVDLRASKDTVAILQALQEAFPHPVGPEQQAAVELLGAINERITGEALEVMATGDVKRLGMLMTEAQCEFDARAAPLCPEQLASPVLHRVLAYEPIQHHIYGGKGVGSQGDGTAQLLCRGAGSQAAVCEILERDLGVHCISFTVPATATAAAPAAAAVGASPQAAAPAQQPSNGHAVPQPRQHQQQQGMEEGTASSPKGGERVAPLQNGEYPARSSPRGELEAQLEEVRAKRQAVETAQLALASAEKALRTLVHATGQGTGLL